jgi:hypothetical protein
LWSTDGKAWNTSTGGFTGGGYGVAWNGSLWVSTGVFGQVWSTDGKVWSNSSGASINGSGGGKNVASAIPLTVYVSPVSAGGVTLAGSTTAGNLLTATGTSGGVYGNSGLTYNGSTLAVGGNITANATIDLFSNSSTTSGVIRLTSSGGNNYIETALNTTTTGSFAPLYITSMFVGSIIASFFSNSVSLLTASAPAFSGLNVSGGLALSNGYRPLYATIVSPQTTLTSSTSPSITNTSYGTHYNILTSGLASITLPTSSTTTDLNAYWVFRNNTGTYLSILVTYTGTGGGGSSTLTIPPATSTTIMFVSGTSGIGAYAFF